MSTKGKMTDSSGVAMVQIPLSAFRCISNYPSEKKMICEISVAELTSANDAETLDEIINQARLDYATGDYQTFKNPKDLIAELRS